MKSFGQLWFSSLILAILLASCGPPTRVNLDESKQCLPTELTIEKTADAFALLAWDPGCPGTRIMQGFNIYLSPVPLVADYPGRDLPESIKPFNSKYYPGDTIGDLNRETYECEDIENATAYYAHVRVVYSDNTLSPPTNEVRIVSYPQGIIELAVSYSGDRDGFSFVENDYCRTDDIENDFYFYHLDGKDYLCSPVRLGPVSRKTVIYAIDPGQTLNDIDEIISRNKSSEKVLLRKGGNYILITEDGYPARLRVIAITGADNDRTVEFEYMYRPPVTDQSENSS